MHILTTIGLFDTVFTDHIEATSDNTPYHSSAPSPIPQSIGPVLEPKSNRVKSVSKINTPTRIVTKGSEVYKKRKTVTEDPMVTKHPIQTKEQVNVNEEEAKATNLYEQFFRKKKLKLPTPLH